MTEDDTFDALKYPPRHFQIHFYNISENRDDLLKRSVKSIIEGHGYVCTPEYTWKGFANENWHNTLKELQQLRSQYLIMHYCTPFLILGVDK